MKFSYAIFDMDGLMFDTENLFIRAFTDHVGPTIGYRFTREGILKLVGLNHQSALRTFPEAFPGCPADCDTCLGMFRAWMKDYICENGVPVKPGLRELLSFLKENGVPCAVATSSDEKTAKGYLENAGLTDFFAQIITGDKVTHGKPDPEIFLLAMQALGASDPAACAVFEDSRNGLLAGANGGFPVIVVPDVMDPTLSLPGKCYAKVARLDEAIGLFQGLQTL